MALERMERIRQLFADALKLPAAERSAFLRLNCGSDRELLQEIESLLYQKISTSTRIMGLRLGESLAKACAGDDEWRRDLEAMLAASEQESEFPKRPAGDLTAEALRAMQAWPLTRPAMLSLGTHLGPYEILSHLGSGGMGTVYQARDTRLNRIVAVKLLLPRFADRPEFLRRFDREARAISGLNHPHICSLYDVGHQNGLSYLVMELLDGETLAQRLQRGCLAFDEVLSYAIQIASALNEAHYRGIVHRDIKPGNVMLTKWGAKLMDFGLATNFDVSEDNPASAEKRTSESGLSISKLSLFRLSSILGRPILPSRTTKVTKTLTAGGRIGTSRIWLPNSC